MQETINTLRFGSDNCPTVSMAVVDSNIFKLSVDKKFVSFKSCIIFAVEFDLEGLV